MHCFEYSILSVAMLNTFFACPEHATEVTEIILFGKKPCIAIRIEEKKCILLHRSLHETNKGYQICHYTNTVRVDDSSTALARTRTPGTFLKHKPIQTI